MPMPWWSKRIRRLNDAKRRNTRAKAAISQANSTWLPIPRSKTRSGGPSPQTW